MRVVLIAAALVAVASARVAPITHTYEVGSNGAFGSSVLSPLVSIIINVNKALSNLVSIEGPDAPAVSPSVPSLPAPPTTLPLPLPIPAPLPVPAPVNPEHPSPLPLPVPIPVPSPVPTPIKPEIPTVVDQNPDVVPPVIVTPELPGLPESPAVDGESNVTNNFFINFFLNFVLGNDGSASVTTNSDPAISSISLPPALQRLLQNFPGLLTAPRA